MYCYKFLCIAIVISQLLPSSRSPHVSYRMLESNVLHTGYPPQRFGRPLIREGMASMACIQRSKRPTCNVQRIGFGLGIRSEAPGSPEYFLDTPQCRRERKDDRCSLMSVLHDVKPLNQRRVNHGWRNDWYRHPDT